MKNMPQRKIIVEITDSDFDPSFVQKTSIDDYSIRKAARGLLIKDGKVALLHVTNKNYHKLPGGGIEGNETIEEGFKREILEETGYQCELISIVGEYPVTIEYRDELKEFQISYVLFANAIGETQDVTFTDEEKNDGFVLKWVPILEMQNVMSKDNTDDYEGKFIQMRDQAIVDYYLRDLVV